MEITQEKVPTKTIVKKSPAELANQVIEVYTTLLEFTRHPQGDALEKRFREMRKTVEEMLEAGLTEEELRAKLDELAKEGFEKGMYSPVLGPHAQDFIQASKYLYKDYQTDAQAEADAKKSISRYGFLPGVREARQREERYTRVKFNDFFTAHPLDEEIEHQRIEILKERCLALEDPETQHLIQADFPGGNFLHHGTNVEQALAILTSGNLVNFKYLYDQENARFQKEGGTKKSFRRNSGYEGISWNFNRISALPGDRRHLVGFLTSPSQVLTADRQLGIPSRPAPDELILLDKDLDITNFYQNKSQQELYSSFGLGETNSVFGNLVALTMYKNSQQELQAGKEPAGFSQGSLLAEFSSRVHDEVATAELLRSKYQLRSDSIVVFSPDLLQQTDKGIPVAAVWLQALLDTGFNKSIPEFAAVTTVSQFIEVLNENNYKLLYPELKRATFALENEGALEEAKINPLAVPTSEMYLLIPSSDLQRYLKVLARCAVWPKGILTFDHLKVRMEHFASKHTGDHQQLTQILREAIPQQDGYIDYETQLLGQEITPEKLAGHKKHVVGEVYLQHRKSLIKNDAGELVVR